MTEEQAGDKIIEYLNYNYWYGVIWISNSGTYFRIYMISDNNNKGSRIYGVLYDEINDLVKNDILVCEFKCDSLLNIWNRMVRKFKSISVLKKGHKSQTGNIIHTTACHLESYDSSLGVSGIFGSADTIDECVNYINRKYPKVRYQIRFNSMKNFNIRKSTQILIWEDWF